MVGELHDIEIVVRRGDQDCAKDRALRALPGPEIQKRTGPHTALGTDCIHKILTKSNNN